MNNMLCEKGYVIVESNPEYPVIQACDVFKTLLLKFHGRDVTIQFNGSINLDVDVESFTTFNKRFENKGTLIFLADMSKADEDDECNDDILSIEEDNIVCAVHGMFDDINIYFKDGAVLQVYGYEDDDLI